MSLVGGGSSQTNNTNTKRMGCVSLVIDHFHAAVLLDPELAHDDVVHAAGGVGPGVGFVMSAEIKGGAEMKESDC